MDGTCSISVRPKTRELAESAMRKLFKSWIPVQETARHLAMRACSLPPSLGRMLERLRPYVASVLRDNVVLFKMFQDC